MFILRGIPGDPPTVCWLQDRPLHDQCNYAKGLHQLGRRGGDRWLRLLVPILHQTPTGQMSSKHPPTIPLFQSCLNRSSQIKLKRPWNTPDRDRTLYRYNPAVVILSIKWSGSTSSFGTLLRDRLLLSYASSPELVSICTGIADGTGD